MAEEDVIIMSQVDLKRLSSLIKFWISTLRKKSAAEILRLSIRQIRRIALRVLKYGKQRDNPRIERPTVA